MNNYFNKTIALTLSFFIFCSQMVFGGIKNDDSLVEKSDFDFNEAEFLIEFEELDQINGSNNDLLSIEGFSIERSLVSTQGFDFSNFDWESGLWGFLCCPIGFFVVAINKNRTKDEKVSFWIGVATCSALNLIANIFIAAAASASTY